ncbi:MAG: hypothetical protein H7Z41_07410 [Cytophagales bacterium]|nr:hypothetical protein [Armatimonadota bacterium]
MQTSSLLPPRVNRALSALIALTALGAGFVSAPRAARAQVSKIIPIRLKIGALLPGDGDTKGFAGSTHLSGEIDVALPSSGGGQTSLVSLGYSEGRRSGRKYRVIPLSLTKVSSPGNPASGLTGNLYYGLGLGLYFVQASGIDAPSGSATSKSRTLLGTSLVAGYQSPTSFFVEGKYHLVAGSVEGFSPNGFSLFIGKRL